MPWTNIEETAESRYFDWLPDDEPDHINTQTIAQGLTHLYLVTTGDSPWAASVMTIGGDSATDPQGVLIAIRLDSDAINPRIAELAKEIIEIQNTHHKHCRQGEVN